MRVAQPPRLALNAAGHSVVGPRRRNNQDAGYLSSGLIAVADGVGGAPCGDLASRTAVTSLVDALSGVSTFDRDLLCDRVKWVNEQLAHTMTAHPGSRGMATTLTALVNDGESGWLIHVGDSRAYRVRDGQIQQISVDQSWVQMMLEEQLLSLEEIRTHPMRNLLLHSLSGSRRDLEAVRVIPVDLMPGDRWILCSDGLSSYLPHTILREIALRPLAVEESAESLLDAVLPWTKDNVTVIVAEVGEAEAAPQFLGTARDERAILAG